MESDSEPPPSLSMDEEASQAEETVARRSLLVSTSRARPRISWHDAAGAHSVILEQRAVAGSAPTVDIVIQDRVVSRLHAEFEPHDAGVWVRDLESKNGTFIEGIAIQAARCPSGGRIRLGDTDLRVDSASTADAPVEIWASATFGPLIGRSQSMRELFARLSKIAPMDAPALIHGETGTGKELVARAIHDASPRASKPFVVVDFAALPDNLIDAELFGHSRGAFTGAVAARQGAIESADGGTVFLDEIGEMPLVLQGKLLRVLESGTVRRVGENDHRAVDVRFVSATHRDVLSMVAAGDFREDLYFRLSVLPVTVPPLRAHREDIEILVNHFLRLARAEGGVSPELMRELLTRPWRGNVRELRNFVARARALGATEALAIMSDQTSTAGPSTAGGAAPAPDGEGIDEFAFDLPFKTFRERWVDSGERRYIERLLDRHGGNITTAARTAEVDRSYVHRLMRKHSL